MKIEGKKSGGSRENRQASVSIISISGMAAA